MSKFVLFSVLVVLMSMYQPINSFGLVRVDIQQDPAIYNAIGRAISSKIQSWNSILSSLLALKNSYKTVNISSSYGSGSSSGSSSSDSSSSSTSGSSSGTQVAYNAIPLYRKIINVNYAAAPISNAIEDSSDDVPTTSSSSVGAVGQTIFSATKVIGGVADVATPSSSSSSSASVSTSAATSSGSASVASPNSVGYSYRKTIG